MKTFIFILLFSTSAIAADFECSFHQNLTEIYRSTVVVNGKDVKIAAFDGYEFFMGQLPEGKYELQALNVYEPSRTYAATRLSTSNPEIELTIWKREAIIEARCTLKAN
jgi:hypothetical protein